MPKWIHDRAKHLQAKNPEMPESMAWGLATQQSHAMGKTPKGYGTAEGKSEAKKKYDTPSDDKKTADPGGIGKEANWFKAVKKTTFDPLIEDQTRQIVREELFKHHAQQPPPKLKTSGIRSVSDLVDGFYDELVKIANMGPPRIGLKVPNYSQVKPSATPVPSSKPVLSPPPVRG